MSFIYSTFFPEFNWIFYFSWDRCLALFWECSYQQKQLYTIYQGKCEWEKISARLVQGRQAIERHKTLYSYIIYNLKCNWMWKQLLDSWLSGWALKAISQGGFWDWPGCLWYCCRASARTGSVAGAFKATVQLRKKAKLKAASHMTWHILIVSQWIHIPSRAWHGLCGSTGAENQGQTVSIYMHSGVSSITIMN